MSARRQIDVPVKSRLRDTLERSAHAYQRHEVCFRRVVDDSRNDLYRKGDVVESRHDPGHIIRMGTDR